MTIRELLNNEEIVAKLDAAENKESFCTILAENGADQEEIDRFLAELSRMGDCELSEEQLEDVAGGGNPILQRYLCKWGYRLQHGKWFVKTTYDEDRHVITATNRFGKVKTSEEYDY